MLSNAIYTNEHLKIMDLPDGIYIETLRKGFPLYELNSIIKSHPEIDITDFNQLKAAINNAPHPMVKIGNHKDRISIDIANSDLKALITFNLPDEELALSNRQNLIKETLVNLKEKGIIFGITKELFIEDIKAGKPYIIAEGTPPISGNDAIIRMYEPEEARPVIGEGGKADYYELNLINKVRAREWLGERVEPTPGIPGNSVKGEPIKPLDGKTIPLLYDKNTVLEVSENGKTTLYARMDGAVSYIDGKVSVSNHLEIDGTIVLQI